MQWEVVIGLEIHVQLSTKSKLFSGSNTQFGAEPNTQANIYDLAMPGTLPVFNEEALRMAVQFGLAIDAEIGKRSVFDRKNYFYPDLPKGFQTTQLDYPIVGKGAVTIDLEDGSRKVIGVTRAHLEEDAGKSLHEDFHDMTGIDLNRAGTPLLEIVSEPDMRNAKEAVAYLKKIHSIVTYLGISDGNMAQGSMRCDVNISVRPRGQKEFGTRTELKNINSFRFVEKAIHYETQRHIDEIEEGRKIILETRLYDSDKNTTSSMRGKEDANDYRYFPEPDLLPIEIDDEYIATERKNLPELPEAKRQRFIDKYQLSEYDAGVLSASRPLADYYEEVLDCNKDAKLSANWVMGGLSGKLNKEGLDISESPVSSKQLAGLIVRIIDKTISGKIAKTVFEAMWAGEGDADKIIKNKDLIVESGQDAIGKMVDEVINSCPEQVQQFKDGKDKVLGFLVGQVMKISKGKAEPGKVNDILRNKLQ